MRATITRSFASCARQVVSSFHPRQPKPARLLPCHIPLEEETLPEYKARSFYPVRIGETLHERYRVEFKLGFGRTSTVWLAQDLKQKDRSRKYVTLKLMVNDLPDPDREIQVCSHLANQRSHHAGSDWVRWSKDLFQVEGPHGKHLCLVFEPLREPIHVQAKHFADGPLRVYYIKPNLHVFLWALDYLHKCLVIHTDIKLDDLLISFGRNDDPVFSSRGATAETATAVLEDHILKVKETPPPRKEISPNHSIYKSNEGFGHPYRGLPGSPVLSDFSNAIWAEWDLPHLHWIQPPQYRAPEVILGAPWSYSVDVWNLGVIICEFLISRNLFTAGGNTIVDQHQHLVDMVALLGPPPKEFLDQCSRAEEFFDSEGRLKIRGFLPENTKPLEELIAAVPGIDGDKACKGYAGYGIDGKEACIDFLRSMLDWVPERRKTPEELTSHPWIRRPRPENWEPQHTESLPAHER